MMGCGKKLGDIIIDMQSNYGLNPVKDLIKPFNGNYITANFNPEERTIGTYSNNITGYATNYAPPEMPGPQGRAKFGSSGPLDRPNL